MKRALALLISTVLLLSLAACSGAASSTAPAADTSAESTAASAAQSTAESTADSAAPAAAGDYSWPQVGEAENPAMVEQDPDEPLTFAFIGFANNSYWDLIYEGVYQAQDFLGKHNVTVEVINLGGDITAALINDALETAVLQGYSGIVLTCFVSGCENYINNCVANDCPVAIIGGDAGECDRFLYIGQDNEQAGQTVAEAIDAQLAGKEDATFAVITASFAMTNLETKRNTCIDYLEGKGYECVGSYEANDSADETYALAEQLLTANPDLDAIYCVAGGTYGAPRAVADSGKTGEVFVIGHDETAENLEYVRTGELTVIGQNPTGYAFDAFVYLYNKAVAGQDPPEEVMASLSMIIDQDNVEELFPA